MELDGTPIYILVSKKTVFNDDQWPAAVLELADKYLPNGFRHWAVRVGDAVWEIGTDELFGKLNGAKPLMRMGRWTDVAGEYNQHFMGMTEATTREIHGFGK